MGLIYHAITLSYVKFYSILLKCGRKLPQHRQPKLLRTIYRVINAENETIFQFYLFGFIGLDIVLLNNVTNSMQHK